MVGSWIAAEARAAVAAEAGFRCSAGVACNKMLAKLVSGLHKPNDQTVMLPSEAAVSGRVMGSGGWVDVERIGAA
jgi:DNA polymerase iota